jgi:hypothetical protein
MFLGDPDLGSLAAFLDFIVALPGVVLTGLLEGLWRECATAISRSSLDYFFESNRIRSR